MLGNRRLWIILSALTACSLASCADDGDSTGVDPCNNLCPAATHVCNVATKQCDPISAVDACNNLCVAPQVCNALTKQCETPTVMDACNNACVSPQVCNETTKQCETPVVVDACNNACVAPQVCNETTKQCETPTVMDACNNTCVAPQKCNETTAQCVECLNSSECGDGKVCGSNGKCQDKQTSDCFMYNGVCYDYADKCSPSCNSEYEVCTVDGCMNKACEGLSWNADNCYCSVTGSIWKNDKSGKCECTNASGQLDSCEAEANVCEEDPDNVVLNWSFEDWDGASLKNWTVRNDQGSDLSYASTTDADTCKTALVLSNLLASNGNLDSDLIQVPEKTFSGGNQKYTCTIHAKSDGANMVFGYIGYDADGKKVSADNKPDKKVWDNVSSVYQEYEMQVSLSENSTQFLVTVATKKGSLTIDSISCVPAENLCTGITCENSWEICDVANHKDENGKYIGKCIPRDGYCSVTTEKPEQGNCSVTEKCNTATHMCERVDGKCTSHKDCKDDAKPYCNTTTFECQAGDVCEKAKCSEWMECTTETRGACVLKEGRCRTTSDCNDKSLPACYGTTHTCVPVDFTYKVENKTQCSRTGYDPETKLCPVNIIPNGSFEEWEEFSFTEKSEKHWLPVDWYALEGDFVVYPGHYDSEIPMDALKEMKTNPHFGQSALQVVYSKSKAERFSSLGFNVPGGTYDCSYWVRGSGEVRVHWYGSRGDAAKSMLPNNGDFVKYENADWTREIFQMKDSQSDTRIIFYVGNTKADDHIVIDDVICTKRD